MKRQTKGAYTTQTLLAKDRTQVNSLLCNYVDLRQKCTTNMINYSLLISLNEFKHRLQNSACNNQNEKQLGPWPAKMFIIYYLI